MKAITFEAIDGFEIVRAIGEPTIDPELTKRAAREALERSEEFKNFDRAYRMCAGELDASPAEVDAARARLVNGLNEIIELRRSIARANPVYFHVPGEELVEDSRADDLRADLRGLKDRELLTLDGALVRDDRGRRAWKLEGSGRWSHATIARLGEQLPDGYQWGEDLSPEDVAEIERQADRDRIAAMGFGERCARATAETEAALDDLARQIARAQIKGDASDLARLREKYAIICMQTLERYDLEGVTDGGYQDRRTR